MLSNYFNELYSSNRQYFGDHPENMLRDYFTMCDKKSRDLDMGIGQGRNARFLLQQGFGVDGIDISSVAIESLQKLTNDEHLDLKLFRMDFNTFNCPPKTYSAILIINLFPVLSVNLISELIQKAIKWLKRKGIIFISGYTLDESNIKPFSGNWKKIEQNSYMDVEGNHRTFLDIDDVIAKFEGFKPIYQWQGFGEMHLHNNECIEQHHLFELILQKY